jgi:hypothetical protein
VASELQWSHQHFLTLRPSNQRDATPLASGESPSSEYSGSIVCVKSSRTSPLPGYELTFIRRRKCVYGTSGETAPLLRLPFRVGLS